LDVQALALFFVEVMVGYGALETRALNKGLRLFLLFFIYVAVVFVAFLFFYAGLAGWLGLRD
jgi:hypothetical protein